MLKGIKIFIDWLLNPLVSYFDKPYFVEFVEDPVDDPLKKVLYIIGTQNEVWQVEMLCPCGCAEKIVLPANEETSPRWTIKVNSTGVPSLSPSVWRSKGCKSHFFLRLGRIKWCENV